MLRSGESQLFPSICAIETHNTAQCLTCVLGGDGIERHKATTSREHIFRQVIMGAHIPWKAAQPFKTHERWWCNICSHQLTQAFFHCQACGTGSNGFDIVRLYCSPDILPLNLVV